MLSLSDLRVVVVYCLACLLFQRLRANPCVDSTYRKVRRFPSSLLSLELPPSTLCFILSILRICVRVYVYVCVLLTVCVCVLTTKQGQSVPVGIAYWPGGLEVNWTGLHPCRIPDRETLVSQKRVPAVMFSPCRNKDK